MLPDEFLIKRVDKDFNFAAETASVPIAVSLTAPALITSDVTASKLLVLFNLADVMASSATLLVVTAKLLIFAVSTALVANFAAVI